MYKMRKTIPVFLLSSCFFKTNIKMKRRSVAKNITEMSKRIKSGILIGRINETIPSTHKILKMLLPIMFPTAKSILFLNIAFMQTANSGRLVPSAIAVAEIKNSPTPRLEDKNTTPSTTNFPAKKSPTIPVIIFNQIL